MAVIKVTDINGNTKEIDISQIRRIKQLSGNDYRCITLYSGISIVVVDELEDLNKKVGCL